MHMTRRCVNSKSISALSSGQTLMIVHVVCHMQMLATVERVLTGPGAAAVLAAPLCAALCDALLALPPTLQPAVAAAGRNAGSNGSEEAVDSAAVSGPV